MYTNFFLNESKNFFKLTLFFLQIKTVQKFIKLLFIQPIKGLTLKIVTDNDSDSDVQIIDDGKIAAQNRNEDGNYISQTTNVIEKGK